jgi:hypothetical protein
MRLYREVDLAVLGGSQVAEGLSKKFPNKSRDVFSISPVVIAEATIGAPA